MMSISTTTLAKTPTIMTNFMRERSKALKTFGELVAIFERDHDALAKNGDPSNDLRSLAFEKDMKASKWNGAVVLLRHESGLVGDGIHRGIAYLRCIHDGANPSQLPDLFLAEPGTWRRKTIPSPPLRTRPPLFAEQDLELSR
jgi:hypothetical protein